MKAGREKTSDTQGKQQQQQQHQKQWNSLKQRISHMLFYFFKAWYTIGPSISILATLMILLAFT